MHLGNKIAIIGCDANNASLRVGPLIQGICNERYLSRYLMIRGLNEEPMVQARKLNLSGSWTKRLCRRTFGRRAVQKEWEGVGTLSQDLHQDTRWVR